MKIYCVEMVKVKLKGVVLEPVNRELRLFSSIRKMETWLAGNGFVYGQRDFFNYCPADSKEWFYKNDTCLEHINVNIAEIEVDDSSRLKFRNPERKHREKRK